MFDHVDTRVKSDMHIKILISRSDVLSLLPMPPNDDEVGVTDMLSWYIPICIVLIFYNKISFILVS
jgi:hypothetical protein